MSIMSPNRTDHSSQVLSEYFLANPAPGTFFKRHLPNRRLLLQLQKVTAATGDTRGRVVPAYDVRCGGSFLQRLAGCFRNVDTKDILIVAAGSEEGGDEEGDLVQNYSILASIRRIPAKDSDTSGKLHVRFFDEVTWNCEQLPSGAYQFTPLSGQDLNVQASWELESESTEGQNFVFSITTGSPSSTPRSSTPRSPTQKPPGTPRKRPRDVLARMDAERIQVFGVHSTPKGSFLGMEPGPIPLLGNVRLTGSFCTGKIDERNLERMVLVSGMCIRALQGTL